MKRKIIATLLLTMVSASWLTGCMSSNSKYKVPSEKEVMEYVDELCPTEDVDYKVIETSGVDGEKLVKYKFSSNDRDLKFEVDATCRCNVWVSWKWYPEINETYRNEIRKYYFDEFESVFEKYDDEFKTNRYIELDKKRDTDYDYGLANYFYVNVDSYEQLDDLANFCYELNAIYAQEEEFNTKEWMKENPLFHINVVFRSTPEKQFCEHGFEIDGNVDYDEIYETLADLYIKDVKAGKVIDDYVSKELL